MIQNHLHNFDLYHILLGLKEFTRSSISEYLEEIFYFQTILTFL